MQLCACLLLLLRLSAVLSESCHSGQQLRFHPTVGVDCVSPEFALTLSDLCDPVHCSYACSQTDKCQAFRLISDGACQCKLFLFDACSHRVQSVPNCTNQVTVYVRSQAGLPSGRLCPSGYQRTRFGTSYKIVQNTGKNWWAANASCSAESGLSKFADAIDLDEAKYLRSQVLELRHPDTFLGGRRESGSGTSKTGWFWTACNLPIDFNVWKSGEPSGDDCANLCDAITHGGIDDHSCHETHQWYICECQSVF